MIAAMLLLSSLQLTPVVDESNWFISNSKTHACVPLQKLGVKDPAAFAQALEKTGSKTNIKYDNMNDGSIEAIVTIFGNVGVATSTLYNSYAACEKDIESAR